MHLQFQIVREGPLDGVPHRAFDLLPRRSRVETQALFDADPLPGWQIVDFGHLVGPGALPGLRIELPSPESGYLAGLFQQFVRPTNFLLRLHLLRDVGDDPIPDDPAVGQTSRA
ncbi:hypothetical protein DSECCO2_485420 [anaerobic digester metagenome]